MFAVREADRDVSFLRRFLTADLARELGLFEYAPDGDALVVTKVATEDDWEDVKQTLLQGVGMGNVPHIRIVDSDYGRSGTLCLNHEHDGRDLHLEYAERTLAHFAKLWRRTVVLATSVDGERCTLMFNEDDGFDVRHDA